MIELQVINYVLSKKSIAFLEHNGISAEHFITYRDEFEFIVNHKRDYETIPDIETFLNKFPDFAVTTVSESEKYLIETLHESYMFSVVVPIVQKVAELSKTNSVDAVEYMKNQVEKISKLSMVYKPGFDIVKYAGEWLEEFKFRLQAEGLLGITSGIKELDQNTHGWLKEDLIIILGRTNEGKTWVMLFFLVMAWLSGKRVLLFSGEMSKWIIGFRFHTLHGHFRNGALMGGESNLGDEEEPKTVVDYSEYIQQLQTYDTPFVVVTPKDIGGRRLTIPVLDRLIDMHKPDIVGVDQISLMDDYRAERGDQRRIQLTHIAEDLYLLSEKYGIPIMSPAQANRDATKNDEEAPELDQVMDSDGIAQNATRVVAIRQVGSTMKLVKRKDRYGKKNIEIMLVWDLDKGVVKPFLTVDNKGNTKPTEALAGEDLF